MQDPSPTAEYVPAEHDSLHDEKGLVDIVPAGQFEHEPDPDSEVYLPPGQ